MVKLLWRILLLLALAAAFTWLANRPGMVNVTWQGEQVEMSLLVALAVLAITLVALYVLWRLLAKLWRSPRTAREYWRFRKHRKAYQSLSRGLIAASAGDGISAHRHATLAGNTLSNEPLVKVLAAQAAQLKGDHAAVKRIFESMAKAPETEVLGLRGLFSEARQSGDLAAAIGYAEKALALNPRLAWASTAVLQIQSARKDWQAAAATILGQARSGLLPRPDADRKRANLLAAHAMRVEESSPSQAVGLAKDALHLEASLVPAALIVARSMIAAGNVRKALRLLRDTWAKFPHPDLAELAAFAKPGDGPEDRFERVRDLVGDPESNIESAVALTRAAVTARRWEVARKALEKYAADAPQARVCALMAEIEEAADDKGRAREWLARAITAPRDPMWVSDGVASPRWTPVSPVTGEIVPCEWKVPFETLAVAPSPAPEPANTLSALDVKPQDKSEPVAAAPPRLPDDPGIDLDEARG